MRRFEQLMPESIKVVIRVMRMCNSHLMHVVEKGMRRLRRRHTLDESDLTNPEEGAKPKKTRRTDLFLAGLVIISVVSMAIFGRP